MTTAIEVFQFPATGQDIRTIPIGGEPWFVAADACALLGFRDASNAVRSLQEDEKGYSNVSTPSGDQRMLIVNESGMYALIFRSKNPQAQAFRKWVTSDLLPTIRRTGRYEAHQSTTMSIAPPPASFQERAAMLQSFSVFGHPDWINAQMQMLWAQANGLMPQIEPDRRMLYVEDYLIERGYTRTEAGKAAIGFGGKLAKQYELARGVKPIKTDRDVRGRVTPVNTYTEADRPLFDAVWIEHYAPKLAVSR